MSKTVEVEVVCPDCGFEQKYHSYKSNRELKGSRRKQCHRCGRSFKVSNQVKSKLPPKSSDKPKGFFKYSKDS